MLFMEQLNFLYDYDYSDCEHKSGFMTLAYVPGGYFCTDCNQLVYRTMPPAINEPDILGYVTATWAWKYVHGNAWTNDLED